MSRYKSFEEYTKPEFEDFELITEGAFGDFISIFFDSLKNYINRKRLEYADKKEDIDQEFLLKAAEDAERQLKDKIIKLLSKQLADAISGKPTKHTKEELEDSINILSFVFKDIRNKIKKGDITNRSELYQSITD